MIEHEPAITNRLQESKVVRMMALGAVVLSTGISTRFSDVSFARESKQVVSQATNLYSEITPDDVLRMTQEMILPNEGMTIKTVNLVPGSIEAQGDCEAGSVYRTWIDTPASLQQEKCDGSPIAINPPVSVEGLQNSKYQSTLNSLGGFIFNSVPGNSLDLKQKTTNLEGSSTGSIKASFECPKPDTRVQGMSPANVELSLGNSANVTFCASDKIVKLSTVNRNDKYYEKAIAKYKSDKFRNEPFWGDFWKKDLYALCPQAPAQQDPQVTFSLDKAKNNIKVAYWSGGGPRYCDEVGQYSEELSVSMRSQKGKNFKKVGNSVLHITGLPETLAYEYGFPIKYLREKATIPNLDKVCGGKNEKKTEMRVKIIERFTPMKSQKFQHGYQGRTDKMKSGKAVYLTKPKKVCK